MSAGFVSIGAGAHAFQTSLVARRLHQYVRPHSGGLSDNADSAAASKVNAPVVTAGHSGVTVPKDGARW